MCGLVGVAGKINKNEKDALLDMMVCNSLRGNHSTGISVIDFNGAPRTFKRACDPYELFSHKAFDQAFHWGGPRCMIAHGRHATMGAKTHYNAHPFEFRNIVGAHNGTIHEYSLRRIYKGQLPFDTDSENVFADMNDGLQDSTDKDWTTAIQSTVAHLSGAWAFTMYLPKLKRLCLLRNEDRPLFYVYSEDKETIFWASEVWMLLGCLARNDIKIHDKPFLLTPNKMLSWTIPHGGKLPTPTSYETKGWSWEEEKQKQGQSDAPFRVEPETRTAVTGPAQTTKTDTSDSRTPTPSTKDALKNVTFLNRRPFSDIRKEMSPHESGHFKTPYKDHKGQVLTKPQFEELISKAGECVYCPTDTVTFGEDCLILAPDPHGKPRFLCKECIKQDEVLAICRGMK